MDVPRRRLLAASGAVLAGGLAGCQSRGSGDGSPTDGSPDRTESTTPITESTPTTPGATTSEATPTDEPTPTPDLDAIHPFAEVRAQPSPDAPGTILAGLTNRGSTRVGFNYGPRLFLSEGGADTVELIEYRDGLERRDGCWRRDSDSPTVTAIVTSRPTKLAPGESLSEEFYLYTPPDVDRCLPAGTYEFEERIAPRFDDERIPEYLVFGLRVTVADDRTLEVETTGPTPDSGR
jgi:hypothetical protein